MANIFVNEQKSEETKMDLTPMIDVTFQLLIFFMLAAKFKTTEGQIQSYLPKEGRDSSSHTERQETRIFITWCNPTGYQYSKNARLGRPVLKIGNSLTGFKILERNNLPDFEALKQELKRWKLLQAGENNGKGIHVIVDAQPMVPWNCVVQAMDNVLQLGIKDVTFAAKEEPID